MQSNTTRGIVYLCVGVLVFSLQDAIIKQVSGSYALTEVVGLRSLVGIPIVLALVLRNAGWRALFAPGWMSLFWRSAIMFGAYTSYYMAFPALPLADAVALYFTVPLFVTALAGPFLGERVDWKVWLAVLLGFAGVMIMLRPGSGLFEPAALLSLLSAALYGTAMLMARKLGTTQSAAVMAFHQNAVFLMGALTVAALVHVIGVGEQSHPSLQFLTRTWTMPTLFDGALIATCGIVAAIGTVLLTNAYRVAPASAVTPFEYTGMLWAPLWGFLFFAETPRWTTLLGAAIVALAGWLATRTVKP
jgi:drug/metabolite transporter (DMT)-like permease